MRFFGTLLLLVLVGGLGVALWWADRHEAAQTAESGGREPTAVLGGRALADAVAIDVLRDPQFPWVELRRDPAGRWRLTEPLRDLAAESRVRSLVDAYDGVELRVAYPADEVDDDLLAQTGLDEPRARLRAEWADGSEVELSIGSPGPFGDDVFVRRGDAILRGDAALHSALQANADGWRDPFVFGNEAVSATDVRIERRGDASLQRERLVLGRASTGRWLLEEPSGLRLDQETAARFVATLLSLRVDTFLAGRPTEGLAPLGPDTPPDVRIEVDGTLGADRVTLRIDGATLIGHAAHRDLWFRVESPAYERAVETPLQALRAQAVFTFAVDDVRQIVVTPPAGAGDEFEFARDHARGAFRMVRPVDADADPTAVAEMLSSLRRMAATRFVEDDVDDLARYGLGAAEAWSIALHRSRREPVVEFRLGDDAGDDETLLNRTDEAHVIAVPRAAADRLRQPWTAWVDREVLRLTSASGLAEVRVRRGDAPPRRFVRAGAGLWQEAGSDEVDARQVETIESLFELRAREVLDAPAVLDADRTPDFVVELVGSSGGTLARLELFDTGEAGLWCRRERRPGLVYVLGALVSDAVRGLAR